MRKTQVAQTDQPDEIPCLLLPLHDRRLLVPSVTVAEVVPMAPFQEQPDAPGWLLGEFLWRGLEVPLLSFERLNGEAKDVAPSGRVAVLNNTGASEDLPFLAIPTLGIPRMARVAESDLKQNPDARKMPFDLMQVKLEMEELVIPDVSALEQVYLKWLNSIKE